MVYLNPGGHDWANHMNLDGWGITLTVFAAVYSVLFYATCAYVWHNRNHPVIRMRNMSLAILSIMILHVYLFIILMVYPFNGLFPCRVEFWVMSIYLPIGIGLFQVQNQQLLLVTRGQHQLLVSEQHYKSLNKQQGKGIGGPKYWIWRLKIWWQGASTQGKYESFVFVGMIIQFLGSTIIYCISRKFNDYGIVSHPGSKNECRHGWEWAPSIIWQLLWNFFFGPYLLWKIRGIQDIYNWRLQTTLAIVAGLAGTPLWLAAIYTSGLAGISKYWAPPMWFAPGLIVMQMTTLIFPIIQIFNHKKNVRETQQALADFDMKKLNSSSTASGSLITGSMITGSANSKRGKMQSMESLDDCLASNCDGLQVYASFQELNGENIRFLVKVLEFKKQWHAVLSNKAYSPAVLAMFRMALDIYVTLIDADTAHYPINIEHHIYAKLEAMFVTATALVATRRNNSLSVISTPQSVVTPWDEPQGDGDGFPLNHRPSSRRANESSEHIITLAESADPNDPLANFIVPDAFDEHVFDAAYKSIRYMVWSETWQRYCSWKRSTDSIELKRSSSGVLA